MNDPYEGLTVTDGRLAHPVWYGLDLCLLVVNVFWCGWQAAHALWLSALFNATAAILMAACVGLESRPRVIGTVLGKAGA